MSSTTKQLPSRSSRGSRINKLLGEEAEADEAFWNQDAWNEDGEDSDYATEAEEDDIVDSDFDDEEDPDEEVHGDDDDEGGAKRKRGRPAKATAKRRVYQEPQDAVKRPRRTPETTGVDISDPEGKGSNKPIPKSAAYEAPQLRHSTARKSIESSDLRRKILEEASRLAAKAKKPQVVKTRLTQQQLLEEAVRTEVDNVQSLNRLERLEEEKKAENVITPKTITFLNTNQFPAIFNQQQPRKRERTGPKEEPVDDDDDDDDDHDGEEENLDDDGDSQTIGGDEEGDTTADDEVETK